ncbi:N-acetyltransferase [candidate division KSB1 bacterium]|nr:MAG: N-acetyltransferase [candidate division KSB1 bacterium]
MQWHGTLRRAQKRDLKRIVEIYNSSIPSRISTADTEPVSVQSRLSWFNKHNDKRPLLVYEHGGEVIAWVSFEDFYGRPAYHLTAELSLYVHKNYQSQGLGTKLLKDAIALSPDLGISNIVGFVFSHNKASLKMLLKSGFEKWGDLPQIAEIDEKLYSLTIMGLKV